MKKLLLLHEEFIQKANRPMTFGALPVSPKEAEAPILPVERWRIMDDSLCKLYKFRRAVDRDHFVIALLSYEAETQHHADILIMEGEVSLKLSTKDLQKVTELDKEYARFADQLFRDLVYSPDHGDEVSEPA